MRSLNRLLSPRTIAVIGGAEAEAAAIQCDQLGFEGEIWPVNPGRTEVAGRPCFAEVSALPEPPDAAFVAVPREATVDVVRRLAERGAGGAVCYASGFAEVGEHDLQDRLVQAAGEMPILGPNCYGFINAVDGVALWPDQHGCQPVPAGAAIISQSGNIALNLTMQRRGLALSHVLAVGNQASVTIEGCLLALLDDPRVRAIGLYIEALTDTDSLAAAAAVAHRRRVPLVAVKAGLSPAGADIVLSHTASLAGSEAGYEALFARYGIARVHTLPELLETLKVLTVLGPLAGDRLASMSCSGGEASLVADRARRRRLTFPPLPPETGRRVRATLSDLVAVSNPLDYHTFIWGDRAALADTFSAMMAGPFDATMLVLDFPTGGRDDSTWWPALEALTEASKRTGARALLVSSLPETLPEAVHERLADENLPAVAGIDEALVALESAVLFEKFLAGPVPTAHLPVAPVSADSEVLREDVALGLLRAWGVPVPHFETVDAAGVADAADRVGYPVTVKALGTAHKTEVGAVIVGLSDQEAVLAALEHLPLVSRYLVEETVHGAVAEVLVGVHREHPLGLVVTVGMGGTLTELWSDTASLLVPFEAEELAALIDSTRAGELITGFRRLPAGDADALANAVSAIVAGMIADEHIREVEVNPLLVRPNGVMAVDGFVRQEVLP